jgi:hypothetical protein
MVFLLRWFCHPFWQVLGDRAHWRIFEVGRSLVMAGVQLQVNNVIEAIDDTKPKDCRTKRTGCLLNLSLHVTKIHGLYRPFNSEIKLKVMPSSGEVGPRTVILRRTRPVLQEAVRPDAERFRAHLLNTGFWLRAKGDLVDRVALDRELSRSCFLRALSSQFQVLPGNCARWLQLRS